MPSAHNRKIVGSNPTRSTKDYMNKGLKLIFCKECNRKRFCSRVSIPGYNFKYTCSKKHSWTIKGLTTERIVAAMEDVIFPSIKNLFDRDDVFYRVLNKR